MLGSLSILHSPNKYVSIFKMINLNPFKSEKDDEIILSTNKTTYINENLLQKNNMKKPGLKTKMKLYDGLFKSH